MLSRTVCLMVLLICSAAQAQSTKPATRPAGDYPALRAMVDRLAARLREVEAENAALKAKVASLEAAAPAKEAPAPNVNEPAVGMTEQQVDRATGSFLKEVVSEGTDYRVVVYGPRPVTSERVIPYYTVYFTNGKVSDIRYHKPRN